MDSGTFLNNARPREPAGRTQESLEGLDHAATGRRGDRPNRAACAPTIEATQGQRRRGAGACATRAAVQPQVGRETNTPEILRRDVYRGFGPTLAAEYLDGKHDIHAGCETSDIRVFPVPHSAITAARPFLSHFLARPIDCAARIVAKRKQQVLPYKIAGRADWPP